MRRSILVIIPASTLFTLVLFSPQAVGQTPPLARSTPKSTQPVTVTSGTFYFGGRLFIPPYKISYVGDVLVVDGQKLGRPRDKTRPPITVTESAKRKQALSRKASEVIVRAQGEGLKESAIFEQLASVYRSSDLVQSVRLDSTSLAVTYRDKDRPEYIIIPPMTRLSAVEEEARRFERKQAELKRLKQQLEDGVLVVMTPIGGAFIPKQRAAEAREAIEHYKRTGASDSLAKYLRVSLWGYLREPELEAAE